MSHTKGAIQVPTHRYRRQRMGSQMPVNCGWTWYRNRWNLWHFCSSLRQDGMPEGLLMSLRFTTYLTRQVTQKCCGELYCWKMLARACFPLDTPPARGVPRGEGRPKLSACSWYHPEKKNTTKVNPQWRDELQDLEDQQSISIAGKCAMSATAPEIDFIPYTMPFSEGNWGPYCYLLWSQLDLQRFP